MRASGNSVFMGVGTMIMTTPGHMKAAFGMRGEKDDVGELYRLAGQTRLDDLAEMMPGAPTISPRQSPATTGGS